MLAVLLLLAASPARAGLLSGQGAFVLDQTGTQRATFSNNERVVLQQKVFNSVASANRLSFRFFILGPTGAQMFQHAGNAVVGSVGNAASQVSGVPVAQFYTGPGFYTFRAEAELDGQVVSQQAQFSVSSPNILLIYPPNGARNMSEVPLTFRWSASGASRYRVTVGDNPSMYNSIFSQDTGGGENFLSYPQNPTDPRQRLTAGQVYYWSVLGLDAAGNTIAQSENPYNLSVNATALAKDLAVTDLTVDSAIGADGVVQLRVRVLNQGNTTENSINLRIGVGGLPAQGTPLAVSLLNPGEAREWTVQGSIPVDQRQTLATACLELFDDNVPNNCKTLSVTRPETPTGTPTTTGPTPLLSVDQMWDMLGELLRERGIDLSEWQMDGEMDPAELAGLIDGLRQGSVQVTLSGAPSTGAGALPITGVPAIGAAKKEMPVFGGGGTAQVATEEVSLEQLWSELGDALKGMGVDLTEWEFADKIEPEELSELVKGLKDGSIRAWVTGGNPTVGQLLGTATPPVAPGGKALPVFETERAKVEILGEPAQVSQPSGEEELGEWAGMAGPAGRDPFVMAIKDADDWAKRWKRLREGRAPRLDFKTSLVVGVVAGSQDKGERVEIEGVQVGTEGLVVRYRLVSQGRIKAKDVEKGRTRARVPYILKQVQASPALDVRFERAEDGGDR